MSAFQVNGFCYSQILLPPSAQGRGLGSTELLQHLLSRALQRRSGKISQKAFGWLQVSEASGKRQGVMNYSGELWWFLKRYLTDKKYVVIFAFSFVPNLINRSW